MFENTSAHIARSTESFVGSLPGSEHCLENSQNIFIRYAGKDRQMNEEDLQRFFDKELGKNEASALLCGKGAAFEAQPQASDANINNSGHERQKSRLSATDFRTMMHKLIEEMEELKKAVHSPSSPSPVIDQSR